MWLIQDCNSTVLVATDLQLITTTINTYITLLTEYGSQCSEGHVVFRRHPFLLFFLKDFLVHLTNFKLLSPCSSL